MALLLSAVRSVSPRDWGLAARIGHGDPHAVEELYELMKQMLRPNLLYSVRETDPHDLLHESLTIVVESIRNGDLRNPAALHAYAQAVIRRQVAGKIMLAMSTRKRMVDSLVAFEIAQDSDDPEQLLLAHERRDLIVRGISRLGSRDTELMTRFYLLGENYLHICAEMHLTATQFRLFKNRAKAKLLAWARNALASQSAGRAGGGTNAQ